jgi:hypothetical protein
MTTCLFASIMLICKREINKGNLLETRLSAEIKVELDTESLRCFDVFGRVEV